MIFDAEDVDFCSAVHTAFVLLLGWHADVKKFSFTVFSHDFEPILMYVSHCFIG
ncbi:hypothetical protein swp_3072 [Shewanella piezotolerans WP3]|uniref:Uncharacterized protein n=1 Tax=Shewanella piezotolerans (strain WP3 / JCM 13877) TaxID=225849 RepID=B8CPS4_SHEPW|nr:hypothetical protein swp_3072 [Shewanella piezotolerans WP3]